MANRLAQGAGAAGLTLALLVGTAVEAPAASATGTPVAAAAAPAGPPTSAVAGTAKALPASKLSRSFRKLRGSMRGRVGIAVTPAGPGKKSRKAITMGPWQSGKAWSTSKVPVAIASLRDKYSSRNRSLTRKAITRSDNNAARKQRISLGSPRRGAVKVQKVMRGFGDYTYIPQGRKAIQGYGGLRWNLARSSRFAGSLANAKDRESRYVLRAMGDITRSQRWGLGKVKGASFKGGWAPASTGYLVRQMGIIRFKDGRCWGVAIASQNKRGFRAAQSDVTKMARWLRSNITKFPAGKCPRLP